MSRSVHTDPKHIRASRRVRDPHAPRSAGDSVAARAIARSLKASGIILPPLSKDPTERIEAPLPRIRVRRPRKGYCHALNRRDIVWALQYFGEICTYGLQSIELVSTPADTGHKLNLGKLFIPGRIVIYPQPIGPWHLPGKLSFRERNRLQRAGAIFQMTTGSIHTLVRWPDDTLKNFMLFDVLMHEIGHHLIQHYSGKRCLRAARTKDHEAFARRFADRCRAISMKDQTPNL